MADSLRQRLQNVSVYLVLLVFIATLGPLQFGYHLVSPCARTNLQHATIAAS